MDKMRHAPLEFHRDSLWRPLSPCRIAPPRPPHGYAVQMLDTDKLLDRASGNFLPVRAPSSKGYVSTFDDAHDAACRWVEAHCLTLEEHRLAIVPAVSTLFCSATSDLWRALRSTLKNRQFPEKLWPACSIPSPLGHSELIVPDVCLGTMTFGEQTSEQDAHNPA
jgi:hypothetical protein